MIMTKTPPAASENTANPCYARQQNPLELLYIYVVKVVRVGTYVEYNFVCVLSPVFLVFAPNLKISMKG
jgi:hypothetical protein